MTKIFYPILFSFLFLFADRINAQCWEMVKTGANHCIGIKTDGTLWTWGSNGSGELGNGGDWDSWSPSQVGTETSWSKVATGRSSTHNLAIKDDGTLWAWGYNFDGQCGNNPGVDILAPLQVGTDNDWIEVACGMFFSLAIKTDGTLWGWGSNAFGQMANPNTFSDVLVPTLMSSQSNWAQITAGDSHMLVLTIDGDLYACGFNFQGSLGNGNNDNQTSLIQIATGQTWTSIAAGDTHSLAIRSDNSLWAWGSNGDGQLGLGDYTYYNTPVQVGSSTDWAKIGAGEFFSLGIKTDGTLWSWGENGYGQLGIGNNIEQPSPVQVGSSNNWISAEGGRQHSVALLEGNAAVAFGRNTFGAVGNGTDVDSNVPVNLFCFPVNMDEIFSERNLLLYPNPSSNEINFDFPAGVAGEFVSIYNAQGEVLFASFNCSGRIDVSPFPSGVYVLKVRADKATFQTMFVRE